MLADCRLHAGAECQLSKIIDSSLLLAFRGMYLLLQYSHDSPVCLYGLESGRSLYLTLNDELPDFLTLCFHLHG